MEPLPVVLGATLTNRATRLEAAIAMDGRVLRRGTREGIASFAPAGAIAALADLAADLLATPGIADPVRLTGAALALEGGVTDGIVTDLGPVPGWADYPIGARAIDVLGVPVACRTMAQAALVAEWDQGAAQGARSAGYIAIGRTVTAAFGIDRRLIAAPFMGSIGHLPIAAEGPRCGCGAVGHLDAIASSQSLVRRMIGLLVEVPATEAAVMQLTGGRAEALQARQIWQIAGEGDSVAAALMAEANDALARAIIAVLLILDPERLVLGGPVAHSADSWLADLRARVARLAPPGRAAVLTARIVTEVVGTIAALPGTLLLGTGQFGGDGL